MCTNDTEGNNDITVTKSPTPVGTRNEVAVDSDVVSQSTCIDQQTFDDHSEQTNDNEQEDWTVQRDALKLEGDTAFRNQYYSTAIHYYTMALSIDPNNGTILSNRSAAYLKSNYKSKALQDALACIQTNSMGHKGISRYAAALQSLKRYSDALQQWDLILKDDPTHIAALDGQKFCQQEINILKETEQQQQKVNDIQNVSESSEQHQQDHTSDDDLDDFFNDVDAVTTSVQSAKKNAATTEDDTVATTTNILLHKNELGTVEDQVHRLVLFSPNYTWYNLNPFRVLDIPHTSSLVDISRRYKALSLLLHPDRFRGGEVSNISESEPNENDNNANTNDASIVLTKEQVQLAYDQVLNAKALLYDVDKLKHMRDLNEEGMKQGIADYERYQSNKNNIKNGVDDHRESMTLDDFQRRAIYRLYATIEHNRQQVLEREKSFYQKEQQNSDQIIQQEKNARSHDNAWLQSERIHTRIDDWRSFQKGSSKKMKK